MQLTVTSVFGSSYDKNIDLFTVGIAVPLMLIMIWLLVIGARYGDLYYPKIEFAKKTFLSLIVILIKLAKTFPTIQDAVNHYEFIYDNFTEKSEILDLMKKSIPNFLETVKIGK